jgi:toxin ParE1/3/4
MTGRKRLVEWSPDAVGDLAEIWSYYLNVAGRDAANNIVREIDKACRLLEEHPFAGRARNEVRPGLRSFVAAPHMVFYRLNRDGVAQIARVLDGRRDIDEIFAFESNGE